MSGFGLMLLMSVLSSAVLFRHLGVVAAGQYLTIVSLVTLMGGLTDAGLSAIGVRELATGDPLARRELMADLIGLRMALSGTGVLAAVAFAAAAGYRSMLVLGAVIAGAGTMATVLQDTYAIPLTARLRLGWVTVADLLRQTVAVAVILALAAAGAGLLPFWAGSVAGGAAASLLAAWLVRREVPLLPRLRPARWRRLLGQTFAYAAATAVAAAYFRVGILIVSLVAGGRQTGLFAISFRVIEVLVIVPQLLIGATFPIFARAARDDRRRLDQALGRMFDVALILGAATALALLVGAPFVVAVVGGARFTAADGILRIQGLALLASFLGALWGYALLSLHRHREILVVSLLALTITLVSTTILAGLDGARGAAVGTVIAEGCFAVMLWVAVRRAGGRPQIRASALPRVGLAGGLGASILLAGLPSAPATALALLIYGGALLLLRAVPQEILDELRRLRRAGSLAG